MIAPSGRRVDMPVGDGFVGMVDRETFDEWLRARAAWAGAERRTGIFQQIERDADGTAFVCYADGSSRFGDRAAVRARMGIGADGALSAVARQTLPCAAQAKHVFAYHEIVRSPEAADAARARNHSSNVSRSTIPTNPSPTGMSTRRPLGAIMRAAAIWATISVSGMSKSAMSWGGIAPPHGLMRPARSSSRVRRPRRAASCAAVAPAGPPPITTTSYVSMGPPG
jgi:2-polyprenyl-6-methoxyphenol hydroxylase-like FAD-dependent oxidoreductase